MGSRKQHQKQVKPYQVFLFLLAVIVISLIPLNFIHTSSVTLFAGFKLKIPDIKTLYQNIKPQYADISSIIDPLMDSSAKTNQQTSNKKTRPVEPLDVPYGLVKRDQNKTRLKDTVSEGVILSPARDTLKKQVQPEEMFFPINDTLIQIDTVKADADQLSQLSYPIEYPQNKSNILHPFFAAAGNLKNTNELIRMLHYGDSQIEGDRITSYLRYKMQSRFGGTGTGLLGINSVVGSPFVSVIHADNWKMFCHDDSLAPDNNFGVLLNKNIVKPQISPDTFADSIYAFSSWIEFIVRRNYSYYKNGEELLDIKLLYTAKKNPFKVSILESNENNDTLVNKEMLQGGSGIHMKTFSLPAGLIKYKMYLEGETSPEVYALIVDGNRGIAVDNIPLRGSAGLEFKKCNKNNLAGSYKKLNVRLIVLQFGVNVVPNIRNDYTYYENWFYSNLQFLKSAAPGIPILVIGVSDMSRKNPEGIYYESYPNIELIRDAQRRAAFRAKCAFWDLYEAMGGYNSMPSWVFAKPALASKDFTHFTPKGAKLISQMIFNALMYEYELFMKGGPDAKH